jgi:hypothetical protein
MKGIQYIINDNGEKTAVVIDLKQWGNLWERFSNFLSDNSFPNEEWLQQLDVAEKLDQALEWNDNNPPQVSDLDILENQLNSYD